MGGEEKKEEEEIRKEYIGKMIRKRLHTCTLPLVVEGILFKPFHEREIYSKSKRESRVMGGRGEGR